MTNADNNSELRDAWLPIVRRSGGPMYLAIADALAMDIASGRLSAGVRLPPQRSLAETLEIDFTTVSRAYAEARKRGLVEGRVGQGTYVRSQITPPPAKTGLVDMSMNLPPRFDLPLLETRLWDDINSLRQDGGINLLLRYQEPGGSARDRAAGATWLKPRLPDATFERILVCPGAQGALMALVGALAAPGETILCEPLTYPGMISLAAHLRLKLSPVACDSSGLLPEAFEAACLSEAPKALYCTPTLQNPTTITLPTERREALVRIARKYAVPIIEDDPYGALPKAPLPPLANIGPDIVYHIASLSKTVSPALRIAYLVLPDARAASRLAGAIRATAALAPPLTAAISTRWIESGTAFDVLAAIRAETHARQAIVRATLPAEAIQTDPEGYHLWLRLSDAWTRSEFTAHLRTRNISVVASDAFAVGTAPEAVRLGLGAATTRAELTQSLQIVADALAQSPALSSLVV
ncbi:PLP-dependent aminotransferase family protein [Asticcacaulis benevestitus]|nr:PLP-dependent aminotransferase family protein [Asticcacaulis benevestitus]